MEDVFELAVLKVKQNSFTNDKGEVFPYKTYFVTISGHNIPLYPKNEDKKYFNLLVENYFKEMGE